MQGEYDTTTCIDVLIHYPQEKMDDMVWHASGLRSLILSSLSLFFRLFALLAWSLPLSISSSRIQTHCAHVAPKTR